MRIIGSDVAYYRDIPDRELIHLAQKEDRLILTRDTMMVRRRRTGSGFFLVEGDSYKEQLKQVAAEFSLDPYKDLLTRCIECNSMLSGIEKEGVKGLVPEYVYVSQIDFWACPECSRIYWPATHKDGIMETLQEIFTA